MVRSTLSHNERHKTRSGWYSGMAAPIYSTVVGAPSLHSDTTAQGIQVPNFIDPCGLKSNYGRHMRAAFMYIVGHSLTMAGIQYMCTGLWPARTWFVEINEVCVCVCVCVCVHHRSYSYEA